MLRLLLDEKRLSSFSLADVRLFLPKKGLFILKGPNGSGKSTLLRILSGRDDVYEGSLFWDEKGREGRQPGSLRDQCRPIFSADPPRL